ncbi:hypothetical protein F2Q70_00022586 [Brassica cretica]|uniref:Uncharacterized protein n=1 Tax=Brassica cretica TaxID=69181 RepID=A0A8S9GLU7_BRACR|nr:hypothetical protein F2Q70_00022586 [Brassica cretica]
MVSIDVRDREIVLKMLNWINLSTIHTCLACLKEPKLTSNTKPDTTACLGVWYTRDRILQTSLEAPLPDFLIIPDIPMRDQGDFQRVAVDALRAIWARVSCTSRMTIRAHSPAAAGPSRQRMDPSSGSDDEFSEATD